MQAWTSRRDRGTIRLDDIQREAGLLTERLRHTLAAGRHAGSAPSRLRTTAGPVDDVAAVLLTDLDRLVDRVARHFPRQDPRIRAAAWRAIAAQAGVERGETLAALFERSGLRHLVKAS